MVVLELLKYRVPAVVILLTLLIQWNQQIPHGIDRDFMEVFSGRGEISRAMRDVGMAGTSIDICLDAKAFDLTGPSAFGLVLNEVMRCKPGSTVVLAPDCRSLSKMCRHTSGRSYLTPMGNRGYVFVRIGNILSGRTVIVALLAAWRGLRFIIEQPDGSFLEHLPRYQWLFSVLKVYAGTMYMGVFGSGSPKRHRLFSNCKYYLDTICDRAGYMSRAEQSLCSNKLVKKYIDKSGKARCSGIKPALKESAHYPAAFGDFLASIALELRGVPVPPCLIPVELKIDEGLTDLELFKMHCLPIVDRWDDVHMWHVLEYFASAKRINIPHGWEEILHDLKLRDIHASVM